MGLGDSVLPDLRLAARPHDRASARWPLPFTFSTFDYKRLCALLWEQCGEAEFDIAKVDGRSGRVVHTDRGDVRAAHVVDALGWRRVLGPGENVQPPDALLSRGLEVHPSGSGEDLELWITPRYVSPGYGWSFPARDEVRIGIGSFDPRLHVKRPTLDLVADVGARARRLPGQLDPARAAPGDRGRRLVRRRLRGPLPAAAAEGIRTALYFGVACGRELAAVLAGTQAGGGRAGALRALLRLPRLEVPRDVPDPAGDPPPARPPDGHVRAPLRPPRRRALDLLALPGIAPPEFVLQAPPAARERVAA